MLWCMYYKLFGNIGIIYGIYMYDLIIKFIGIL